MRVKWKKNEREEFFKRDGQSKEQLDNLALFW